MKAAITMIPESGRISPVFETAEYLLTVQMCRNAGCRIIARNRLPESESEKIEFLRSQGVRMLICGAVCNETLEKLCSIGMRVVPFASGSWSTVVEAAVKRSECLPQDYIMPGCCRHHRKCCQHQGGGINENSVDQSG